MQPGAFAVFGPEAFLKREAVSRIIDQALGSADRSLSLAEYDGPSAELAPVLDDLRTLPFLGERRLVRIREADPFITAFRAELEAYVEKPSSTGVLLLECKSLAANTRLYKRIDALGGIVACPEVKPHQVVGWLNNRAREAHGIQLDSQAANLLADLVGNDLGLLDGELQKLALYADERKRIVAGDVRALVGQQREEQIWGLMSAMAAGNAAEALAIWEEVLQTDRAAEMRSVAGIAYKVRQLLGAKKAQAAGAPLHEIARLLMMWNDKERAQAELNAFSTPELERILCRLLEADVAGKSGGVSVQASIESLIIDVCRTRQPKRAMRA